MNRASLAGPGVEIKAEDILKTFRIKYYIFKETRPRFLQNYLFYIIYTILYYI